MAINGVRDKEVALGAVEVDSMDLAGKKLVVVGGTNGLGRAIARLAVERGAVVVDPVVR